MSHLLIVILSDLERMPALVEAWQAIGVPDATILESAGALRTSTWLSRVGLGALDRLFETEEVHTRTLLAAIDDDKLLARAVAETEQVVGGFEQPDSGVLLVLPLAEARGLVQAIVGNRGTAGGHGTMAGGQIPLKGEDPEELSKQLLRRALQYLKVARGTAGEPLV